MSQAIRSEQGWFVLHIYYRVDRAVWEAASAQVRRSCTEKFAEDLRFFRSRENCQAHCYAIWGHKADCGLMLVDPDLDDLNRVENQILSDLPAGLLTSTYSFTSMSEISEYMSQEKDYDATLREHEGLSPDSDEYKRKMEEFRARMKHYTDDRLYPQLPPHRVMCFYPMNKKRGGQHNWYLLPFDRRKLLMGGHMITGRKFAGKVKQLVTGSAGLDAWEWGVTLFADDPFNLKRIVYEMRYDEVSAIYAEFGDFLVGIEMSPEQLFDRLGLN